MLVAALLDLVVEDYKISKKRSLDDLEYRIDKNLRKTLGTVRASTFSSTHIDNHIRSRRSAGACDATINRELAIVRRAFSLGMRTDPPLVNRKPWIRRLDEDNAREGFIEEDQYRAILNELPEHLRALFVVGYHIGVSLGTLRMLEWDQVDLKGGQIRLRKKQVKQKRAHTAPIYGHMRAWLEMQSSDRDQNWPSCPYVFHWHDRPIGAHLKDGERHVSAPGYRVSSSMTCGVPPFATWNAPACPATSRWELQAIGPRQSTADTTSCPRKT